MSGLRVFALCGSLRAGSYNRKLLALATRQLADAGAEVDVYDLRASPLPFYDGDLEAQGTPEEVMRLRERIDAARGLLFATPEYNHNLPAALKNAIDWASRPLPPLEGAPHPKSRVFAGKLVALLGTSTGMSGTLYCQLAMREVLASRGAWVLPSQLIVPFAASRFDADGQLDQPKRGELAVFLAQFLQVLDGRPFANVG